ncbi:MAG: hypothetical protein LUJ25_04565 [Firmicutes bacterium]|nr:hypothetical protein [Bacillota bacterium]
MGYSLEEYAALHGKEAAPIEENNKAAAIDAKERAAALEKAADLKRSIIEQLEQGTEPQYILYTAIKVISLLSNDADFQEQCTAQLDSVYADIAQRSLFNDNAIIEGERLAAKTADYNGKLRRQINRQLAGYQRIAKELNGALQALDELEQGENK